MKKLKYALILLALVLLAAAWTVRYVSINRYYESLDNNVELTWALGELVPLEESDEGYYIRVDGFRIADYGDVCPDAEGDAPEKLALVDITLKNTGSDAEGIPLSELPLYGIDEVLFLDYAALDRLNPVLQGNSGIRLADGTEYRLTLPYGLYKANFSRGTWNDLDRYGLFLQLTGFPTRKSIVLQ